MKMIITAILAIVLTVVAATTAFARPFDYSEDTKNLNIIMISKYGI